jgi:hypothetical protein
MNEIDDYMNTKETLVIQDRMLAMGKEFYEQASIQTICTWDITCLKVTPHETNGVSERNIHSLSAARSVSKQDVSYPVT